MNLQLVYISMMFLKVINILKRLVKKGNSVFVIEHNLNVISQADYIIDMGIQGGKYRGNIIAEGTPRKVIESKDSLTASVLREYL
ncbi:hypothetical protein [Enterococcus rivorum]|nr:hypothetical protein [Enterococcus rivorum]